MSVADDVVDHLRCLPICRSGRLLVNPAILANDDSPRQRRLEVSRRFPMLPFGRAVIRLCIIIRAEDITILFGILPP